MNPSVNQSVSDTQSATAISRQADRRLRLQDSLLLGGMAVLAACGLIYEYLLSHYAGRVLGAYESTLYTMIGLMIVAMGLGAFAARKLRRPLFSFVLLEALIAVVGATSILLIAALVALGEYLPQLVGQTFGFPVDGFPAGGLLKTIQQLSKLSPFVLGSLLGFMIGMEIPLIARVREQLWQRHLAHNAGTIYGADYIGAGIGAAVWVLLLLQLEVNQAAALTAAANWLIGMFFMLQFRSSLAKSKLLWLVQGLLLLTVISVYQFADGWSRQLGELLYRDQVVHQQQTRYQTLVFTERVMDPHQPPEFSFYINGRLQFASQDEQIYHSLLVTPALAGSGRQQQVLIIGGGDGLALRDVLRWEPEQVTLIDLDPELVELFAEPDKHLPPRLAASVDRLTAGALRDPRLELITADAFVAIDQLLKQQRRYDSVIIDLPDPSHPDLNKLYSSHFYARLRQLLSADGLLVTQSTSPYHAPEAFISIGLTLQDAGFAQVEQYHANVPSFGEWGWTIAAPAGPAPRQRLQRFADSGQWPVEIPWLTPALLQGAFEFPAGFYRQRAEIRVNTLGSHQLYQYHHQAWRREQGL